MLFFKVHIKSYYKFYIPDYNVHFGNQVSFTAQIKHYKNVHCRKALDLGVQKFRGANYNDNGIISSDNDVVLGMSYDGIQDLAITQIQISEILCISNIISVQIHSNS